MARSTATTRHATTDTAADSAALANSPLSILSHTAAALGSPRQLH